MPLLAILSYGDNREFLVTLPGKRCSNENSKTIMIGFLLSLIWQQRDNEQMKAFDGFCNDTENSMRLSERVVLGTCFCIGLALCIIVYLATEDKIKTPWFKKWQMIKFSIFYLNEIKEGEIKQIEQKKESDLALLMCRVESLNRRPMRTTMVASDATQHRKHRNHHAAYAFATFSVAQSMDSEANRYRWEREKKLDECCC